MMLELRCAVPPGPMRHPAGFEMMYAARMHRLEMIEHTTDARQLRFLKVVIFGFVTR